uniref:Uncharacterized protein n=1 Tax=Anguilla anguilla TaxID=7936 RepID=A0A0E9WYX8_ANGAN
MHRGGLLKARALHSKCKLNKGRRHIQLTVVGQRKIHFKKPLLQLDE